MVNSGLFVLMPLLVLGLIAASFLGLIYLWYRVFKQRSALGLSVCGQCGYAVRGLEGLVCPECGADLREVGIVTPARSGRVTPVVFIIAWTLLLPGPAYLTTSLIVAVLPNQQQFVTATETFQPSIAGEYQYVMLSGNGVIPFQTIDVDFVAKNGFIHSIIVDNVNFEYKVLSRGVSSWQVFDSTAILTCFQGIGADVKKQHVQDEADELLTIIRNWRGTNIPSTRLTPGHLNSTAGSSSTMTGPPPILVLLIPVAWIFIWLGGFFLFFRIRLWSLLQAVARMFS